MYQSFRELVDTCAVHMDVDVERMSKSYVSIFTRVRSQPRVRVSRFGCFVPSSRVNVKILACIM